MKKLKLFYSDMNQNDVLGRNELKNILGGYVAPATGGSCYKCKENGEWVYNNGSCATTTTKCDAGTCSDYAC